MQEKTKGILTVCGGVLLHLWIGWIYIWGNISVYVTSYYRHFDSSITLEDTFIILPLNFIGNNGFMYLGSWITLKYTPQTSIIIGICLVGSGVLISSFMPTFVGFAVFYGGVFGIGCGLIYLPPVIVAWSYFPERKGLISGIIIGAFGLGAAIFDQISSKLVNPDNEDAHIKVKHGSVTDHYYGYDVSYRVPAMLRWLCLIWFIMMVVGCSLVSKVKQADKHSVLQTVQEPPELPSLTEGLKGRQAWILFFMGLLSSLIGIYFAGAFKIFGEKKIDNDQLLSVVGSVGQICNGGFRFCFGILIDKTNFRIAYTILNWVQIALGLTVYYIADIFGCYLIWVGLLLAWEGGHFVLFPTVCGKIYGKKMGSKMYGIIGTCFALSALLSSFLQQFLISSIGYFTIFLLFSILSGVALVILYVFFREKSQWTDVDVKNEFAMKADDMSEPLRKGSDPQ